MTMLVSILSAFRTRLLRRCGIARHAAAGDESTVSGMIKAPGGAAAA
jgi:hypothetical protein